MGIRNTYNLVSKINLVEGGISKVVSLIIIKLNVTPIQNLS